MRIADLRVWGHRSGQAGAQQSFDCARDQAAPIGRMVRRSLMACGRWCGAGVLLLLLAAGVAAAQSQGKPKIASDTKEDIKQAQQFAGRGDNALAAGKMNEALADYEQAVKHAPGD